MKVSLKWLSDYVDIKVSTEALIELLTMRGMEVESVEKYGGSFDGVVAASIEQVHPHPNADKLSLCDVTDGRNLYTVVCGAPNCRPGLVTALALAGANLPGGKVQKATIRGVKSAGMLVSKRELGLSEDHSGIIELPADIALGRNLVEIFGAEDTVIDLSITPNRPDLLNMIGIAREIAAATAARLKKPDVSFEPVGGPVDRQASVEILDPDLCLRYTGILVKGLTIGPSPVWLVQRLEAVGLRSINNVVDITNFVNLEIGQPLHAFDFDFFTDHKIVVRRCKPGEKITTLDGVERTLPENALLICDGKKPVALAGIMGGANSLVTEKTRDVLIESAFFLPTNIRRTGKTIGLSSESSYRFERGVDIEGVAYGLHRAARLMESLAGGKVAPGFIDNYPGKKAPEVLALRPDRANHLLGTELDAPTMAKLLRSIELPVQIDNDLLQVTVPTFRVDLEREVDLIEEVARTYGYDRIAPTLPKSPSLSSSTHRVHQAELAVREILSAQGLHETLNYAFIHPERLDWFKTRPGVYLKLKNPINEDFSVLRDSLLPGLCQNLVHNFNRQARRVALYEVRRVYLPGSGLGAQPHEPLYVSGALAGRRDPDGWAQSREPFDFFDLKGVCEVLFEKLGVSDRIVWQNGDAPYLSAACNAEILYQNKTIGHAGELNRAVAGKFDLAAPAFVFEINLAPLIDQILGAPEFKPMSRFPMTTRDLAIVVHKGIKARQVVDTIFHIAPDLISDVILFDVYTGDKIGKNEKSLALSIRMQKSESEVSEAEAERVVRKAVGTLMSRFEAKLRE